MACPGRDPIIKLSGGPGFERKIHAYCRINRSFGDRAALKPSIFGISPCAFLISESFSPRAECVEMGPGVYKKIAVFFVMNKSKIFRIVERGVADLVFVNAEIVMEKNADLA